MVFEGVEYRLGRTVPSRRRGFGFAQKKCGLGVLVCRRKVVCLAQALEKTRIVNAAGVGQAPIPAEGATLCPSFNVNDGLEELWELWPDPAAVPAPDDAVSSDRPRIAL